MQQRNEYDRMAIEERQAGYERLSKGIGGKMPAPIVGDYL
jgi:hypothetical protein